MDIKEKSKREMSFYKTQKLIRSTKWKLNQIYETGIVPDVAHYKDVEIVFGPMHIYAMFKNRLDKFPYRFISPNMFEVEVDNHRVKCRIDTVQKDALIFHADLDQSHFIIEMEKAV